MTCYRTLLKATLRRLKLPPLADAEVRDLLNAQAHDEVHAAIERPDDEGLFAIVMGEVRPEEKPLVKREEVTAYA